MLKKILDNQQGAALVAGMLILVSLTLLGIGGLTLTSIDTQISRNYRTSVQAVELANAVVAQMIYWFNNPTTFTDTTVGSYLGGTNSSEKGTNFFAKRRPSGITKSFFTSNGSQFYDVNGDNSTLASESSPALVYDAGTSAQKAFLDNTFSGLGDIGNITNLKIWGTPNPADVCTVQITAESSGGGRATIEVVLQPGPVLSIGDGLQVGASGAFAGQSAKIHWSNALIVGDIDNGSGWNWQSYNPAQRTTGTAPGDTPDKKVYGTGGAKRLNDPWLNVYVGGIVRVNDDVNGAPCSNDVSYDWNTKALLDNCNPNHTNVYPGRNNDANPNNNVVLDIWDYHTAKSYGKRNTVTKGGTTYPGYYYTQPGVSNKNKIWDLSGTQYTFSSFINGITEGLMFVDTTDQQVPNATGSNLQEISLNGLTYTKGSFYLAADINVMGLGSPTNKNVQSPPWDPTLADPATSTDPAQRVAVNNLPVHINGAFYTAGVMNITGNLQIFGALVTERGFSGAGTPEIWYDYDLRDGPGDVSPVITKYWREIRE